MALPSRNSNPPRSRSSFQYFAFLAFAAIFVFKVDVFISQTISSARRNLDTSQKQYLRPTSYSRTSPTPSFSNGTFNRNFILTWGETRAKILEKGELLTLSLDKASGSGFESKKEYLFAKIDMQIRLIPGNSAGTVTTYYFSSEGPTHDEIDFEFLGNSTGNPYTLHTNVFSQGKGDREQQFVLWFDPTQDFHTYSILWNPKGIILSVDGTPIREFKNMESIGVPFPKDQPMRIYSSVWNADDWATQGGRVKTDWSLAPFTASYRNFSAEACIWSPRTRTSSCDSTASDANSSDNSWLTEELDYRNREEMELFQQKYMTYNYCLDPWRFPQGPGPECKLDKDDNVKDNSNNNKVVEVPITRRPRRGRRRGRSRRGNRGSF